MTVRVTVQTSERPPDRDDRQTTSRPDIPSSARIYDGDYFLGGKDNYPADRDAADQITAYLPNTRKAAHINRAFVRRAVRYLVNEMADRHPHGVADEGKVHDCYYYALVAAELAEIDQIVPPPAAR